MSLGNRRQTTGASARRRTCVQGGASPVTAFGHVLFRRAWLVAGLLILPACSGDGNYYYKGDFGRPVKSELVEKTRTQIGNGKRYVDRHVNRLIDSDREHYPKVSKYALTNEELALREEAVHFKVPTPELAFQDRMKSLQPVKDGVRRIKKRLDINREERPLSRPYRPARLTDIDKSLHTDMGALKRFGQAAVTVIDMDFAREATLTDHGPDFSDYDRRMTVSRIRDNRRIIADAFVALMERVADYDYGLDRIRLDNPGENTRQVEARLDRFKDRITTLHITLRRQAASRDAFMAEGGEPEGSNSGQESRGNGRTFKPAFEAKSADPMRNAENRANAKPANKAAGPLVLKP